MTARTTRKPRKTPTKKQQPPNPAPRLSLAKTVPARPVLPVRDRDFLTAPQCHAALTAATTGIPTLHLRDWRDHRDNTATRRLPDGSLLHYQHDTHTLTWHTTCPMGAVHAYTINSPSTAAAARVHAARCTRPHADLTHLTPLTRDEWEALGIHTGPTWARPDLLDETPTETIPVPLPTSEPAPEPRVLADTLARTRTGTDDTQPMNRDQITAGLAQRTANSDTPREHPQP